MTSNPDYGVLRYAIKVLEMFSDGEFRTGQRLLSEQEFHAVHQCRNRFHLEDWCTELMLRSALSLGVSRQEFEVWQKQYESLPFDTAAALAGMKSGAAAGGTLLTLQDLRALALTPDLPDSGARLLFRSLLNLAGDHQRDEIVSWARRLIQHGTA